MSSYTGYPDTKDTTETYRPPSADEALSFPRYDPYDPMLVACRRTNALVAVELRRRDRGRVERPEPLEEPPAGTVVE